MPKGREGFFARITPLRKPPGSPGTPENPIELPEPGEPEEPEVGEPGFPTPPIHLPDLPDEPVHPLPPITPPVVPPGGGKPAGFPTLPMDPAWTAPTAPPHGPGTWVTINAGKGHPPAWAFVAQDDGLAPAPASGPPTAPPTGAAAGHWVPIGPAKQPKGEDVKDPVWAWVPHIGADYGVKPAAQPKSK